MLKTLNLVTSPAISSSIRRNLPQCFLRISILVYSNYQRQGKGRKAVDLISSLGACEVFIVPKANEKSLSFFRTLNNLSHVRNGNLFVFNSV